MTEQIGNSSQVKSLSDFELFGPNLIDGVPFDYGFTFTGNSRAIQKKDQAALEQSMAEHYAAIAYVKEGPDSDFIPFGSKDAHIVIIRQGIEKTENKKVKWSKKTLIISLLVVLLLLGLFFLTNQGFEGSAGIFIYLTFIIIGSAGFLLRKRIESKMEVQPDKVGIFYHAKKIGTGFNHISVFILPAILIVIYIFQYANDFHVTGLAVQGGKELQLSAIFTATFVESNAFYLGISVLAIAWLSARFIHVAKLRYLLIVFITTAMIGNTVYNSLGEGLLMGPGTGIAGILAAYLVVEERYLGGRLLFQFVYWVVVTMVWLFLLYAYSEWSEFIQYGVSFWCGALLALIIPVYKKKRLSPANRKMNKQI